MRTSNPVLTLDVFEKRGYAATAMTVDGAVNKTAILLCLVLLSAGYSWQQFFMSGGNPAAVNGLMTMGFIGGFICALITTFKAEWAGYTAPAYALLEGLALGSISAIYEASFPGLVMQSVGLTFGVLGALLMAYKAGAIQVTDKFRMGLFAATGGIALLYLGVLLLSLFGVSVPIIQSASPFGIIFSCVVVVVAALNLVLDFDFFVQGERAQAPKYMEWYAAFGLMVTLVWMYLEILRLLSKLRSRDE